MSDWKPPHEETWHVSYDDLFAAQSADEPEADWERIFEGSIGLSGMEKRLKLAAAAPEMARLLLELEWAGDVLYPYDTATCDACPSCFALHTDGKHEPDCELVRVLVKAGVRAS